MALTTPRHEQTYKESTISYSKTCNRCGQTKPAEAFGKNKNQASGLQYLCKSCVSARVKAYRKLKPEKVAAYSKKYRQADPQKYAAKSKEYRKQNPKAVARYKQAYRSANLAKIAATAKRWHEKNSDKSSLDKKAWHLANPNYRVLSTQKRRALKLRNGAFRVTGSELDKLRAMPCAYCGAASEHIDHVVPISRGGTHGIGNLVGACAPCNLSKGKKFIMEWKL